MIETLVVRTFGIDVSDTKASKELHWKIGRLFPWLFTENTPVCFLGVGKGWRGWKQNGLFSSHASVRAFPSDSRYLYHLNRFLAWVTNFIDIVRFARKSTKKRLIVMAHTPAFGLGAALAKLILRDRILFVVRILGNEPSVSLLIRRSQWRFRLEQIVEKFVLTMGDLVVPMGNFTYDLSIAYGVDPRKIVVLPFPVTWSMRPKNVEFPMKPTVLFCGRLTKEKGVHILIRAMKSVLQRIPDARLVVVGDTDNKSYRCELEKTVEVLGMRDSVTFLGWVSNDQIAERYQQSWVLVVPSIWEEGLGMVMVEAGLMQRPVIASDLGGIKDFIQDGVNGLLVVPGDIDALAHSIVRILENQVYAHEMGKRNEIMAHNYLEDFERSVPRVQQAIDELAAME
jgi:glycosyltransferase involved in cell wall biosynthesis